MLGCRWQRIAEQTPPAGVVRRLGPIASKKTDRLFANPFPTIEGRATHLRCALSQAHQQIPELDGVELDRRCSAKNYVRRLARDGPEEFEQIVRLRRLASVLHRVAAHRVSAVTATRVAVWRLDAKMTRYLGRPHGSMSRSVSGERYIVASYSHR